MSARIDWSAEAKARDLWPKDLTLPSQAEAVLAARRLFRFATGQTWLNPVRITSGRSRTRIKSREMVINPDRVRRQYNGDGEVVTNRGWVTLVQALSIEMVWGGWVDQAKVMRSTQIARLEEKMIREVIARGWLEGALSRSDAAKPELQDQGSKNNAALKVAAVRAESERIQKRLRAWTTRRKRADTAIRKLTRRARFIEKKLGELSHAG